MLRLCFACHIFTCDRKKVEIVTKYYFMGPSLRRQKKRLKKLGVFTAMKSAAVNNGLLLPALRPYSSILIDMCPTQLSGRTRIDSARMAGWR